MYPICTYNPNTNYSSFSILAPSCRMKELYDYPKYSAPFKRGSRYFYFMNTGLQNQQ